MTGVMQIAFALELRSVAAELERPSGRRDGEAVTHG